MLSRIACFRSPVGYGVLEAISCSVSPPSPPKLGETALQSSPILGDLGDVSDDSSPPKLGDVGGKTAYSTHELEADLRDLINRGLLHHDRPTQRFDLHPIVRRYAYDRMGSSERTSAHQQLRDYFAAVPAAGNVQTLADLTPAIELYHHMVRAGQYDEAQKLFRDRLRKLLYYQLGAYQLQIELLRALFPQGEDQPPQLQNEVAQGWTLNELANSYSLNGQPMHAMLLFEQAVTICETQEQKQYLAIGLGNLAYMVQLPIGALQAAEANLRRSIALCQEMENELYEAVGHQEWGRLLAYRGLWAEAEAELDKALELFEQQNNGQSQGVTWAYRVLSALLQVGAGNSQAAAKALAAAQRSLELADETSHTLYPHPRDYVRSHWLLGAAHRVNGKLDDSETYQEGQMFQNSQPPTETPHQRGIALLGQERYQEALSAFDEAIQLRPQSSEALVGKAVTLHGLNRLQDALIFCE